MIEISGYHEAFIDDKGRVIIPKKLKEKTGLDLVITRGFRKCVYILPPETWQSWQEKMSQLSLTDGMDINYFFTPHKTEVTLDKQGRMQIPMPLRRLAGIEESGNVLIVGMNNRMELWNPDRYNEMMSNIDEASILATMQEVKF